MAEGYAASRSRDEARERIRLITEELARRSRTEHLKAEADALRIRLTAQAKAKASEKADELKARAKDAAREKALTIKEQVMAKPVALAIAGGVAGAVVGALLGRRSEEAKHYVSAGSIETTGVTASRWETERTYDVEEGAPYYGNREVVYDELTATGHPHGEGMKETAKARMGEAKEKVAGAVDQAKSKAAGAVEQAKVKAEDLKERAAEAVSGAREKLSEKAPSLEGVRHRAGGFLQEDPVILAFGAIAFGATLGLLMPLSDPERRALRSAHAKAKEGIRTGVERAQELISERAGEVVPSLLGVKKEHREEREVHEGAEAAGEEEIARRGTEGFEPPAIH